MSRAVTNLGSDRSRPRHTRAGPAGDYGDPSLGLPGRLHFLKTSLNLSDGNLASHLRTLEEAGYIQVTKQFIGRRPNTMYKATDRSRAAYESYRKTILGLLK